MISFSEATERCASELISEISRISDADATEYAREVVESFVALAEELEVGAVALSYDGGFLFARIWDGEKYVFPYPVDLTGEGDVRGALRTLAEYARAQLVPLYISDLPREELLFVQKVFSHVDARCYPSDEDCFLVRINNECDLLERCPSANGDGVRLDSLGEECAARYGRLCTDAETNRFWSYDYRADMGDEPDGVDFIDVAEKEFSAGIAICFGIYGKDSALVGEIQLYDFDYYGSAELAVRLLPEYRGRGIADAAVTLCFGIARDMGLHTVRARVDVRNTRSLKFISRHFDRVGDDGKTVYFEKTI